MNPNAAAGRGSAALFGFRPGAVGGGNRTAKFFSGASHIPTYRIVFEPLCLIAFSPAQPRFTPIPPQV